MDPLSCKAKFEVMQPPYVLTTRAPIFQLLYYRPIKWRSYTEDPRRLYDLKLCHASQWVHMGDIWNIWAFGLIGSIRSQKWPPYYSFY